MIADWLQLSNSTYQQPPQEARARQVGEGKGGWGNVQPERKELRDAAEDHQHGDSQVHDATIAAQRLAIRPQPATHSLPHQRALACLSVCLPACTRARARAIRTRTRRDQPSQAKPGPRQRRHARTTPREVPRQPTDDEPLGPGAQRPSGCAGPDSLAGWRNKDCLHRRLRRQMQATQLPR